MLNILVFNQLDINYTKLILYDNEKHYNTKIIS